MNEPSAPPAPTLSPDGRLFWDGEHWQPLPAAANAAPAGRTGGFIVLAGSALVAVGTLLPYVTATGAFGISLSRAGVQGDGVFVLLSAAVPMILAAANLVRRPPAGAAVLFTALGALSQAVIVLLVWHEIASVASTEADIVVDVGIGVYVSAIGAVATIVGAVMAATAWGDSGTKAREASPAASEIPVAAEPTETPL